MNKLGQKFDYYVEFFIFFFFFFHRKAERNLSLPAVFLWKADREPACSSHGLTEIPVSKIYLLRSSWSGCGPWLILYHLVTKGPWVSPFMFFFVCSFICFLFRLASLPLSLPLKLCPMWVIISYFLLGVFTVLVSIHKADSIPWVWPGYPFVILTKNTGALFV